MKIIERVVKSAGSPWDNDLWLKEEGDSLSLNAHHNGSWRTVAGGGGSSTGHMVVTGRYKQNDETGNMEFVPSDGQPTFSEAVEAFESGIPVTLVRFGKSTRRSSNVLCYDNDVEVESLIAYAGVDYLFWVKDESPDPESDQEA